MFAWTAFDWSGVFIILKPLKYNGDYDKGIIL
jgi:hypothetical protein